VMIRSFNIFNWLRNIYKHFFKRCQYFLNQKIFRHFQERWINTFSSNIF
jgi:hypothetical protein